MEDERSSDEPMAPPPRKLIVWLDEAVLIVLLLLSLAGAAISAFSPQDDYLYWLAMIPVFWLGALFSGMAQARRRGENRIHSLKALLVVELLHWGGVLFTVVGVFVFRYMRIVDESAAALVMLLILALATYLNGIRIGWRFSLIGIFLGMTAVLIAYVEQFLPLAVLLAVTLIVFSIYWGRRSSRHRASQTDHVA